MTPITFQYFLKRADAILCEHGNTWWCSSFPEKIVFRDTITKNLSNAKLLFLFGDSIYEWAKVFQSLTLNPKYIIIGGTDITFTNSVLHSLLTQFSETHFYITNWVGSHPRCTLLPLGLTNGIPETIFPLEKKNLFGISYCRPNSIPRFEFFEKIEKLPDVHPYMMKELASPIYFKALSTLYFSCCPMGGGLDTIRFWESLYLGAIPVVKNHFFYSCLKRYYPNIPMIVIEEWEDLPTCIDSLSVELYESLMKTSEIEVLSEEYWEKKLL
jgi:hypothetical protein